MTGWTAPSLLLRRTEYGDYDYIVTLLTEDRGKVTAVARNAKKSVKRFGGALELFSHLTASLRPVKRTGAMPVLQEVSIEDGFSGIRSDFRLTAYASFWAELVNAWLEPAVAHPATFQAMRRALDQLNRKQGDPGQVSIRFLMQFLGDMGVAPNLERCAACKRPVDQLQTPLVSDTQGGGFRCRACAPPASDGMMLSKGTVYQLRWLQHPDRPIGNRLRYSEATLRECLMFAEAFASYYLGRPLKSYHFLKESRHRCP